MRALHELDRILRGEDDPANPIAVRPVAVVCLLLAAGYGLCMGVSGLFRADGPEYRQAVASAGKVPVLFAITLFVTFPSLYVCNVLFGSRLRFGELLRLVLAALAVMVAVLAAFGPIVAFFSVTTTSYPFLLLLNVAVFAGCGLLAMRYLHRALLRAVALPEQVNNRGNVVFVVWLVLFGVVGAQTGWVLRPFVGSPDLPFAWFRPREASFFEGVFRSVRALVGG